MLIPRRLPIMLATVVLAVLCAGCFSTKPKKQSGLMKSARDITFGYSAEDLRLLMRDAVGPITGLIEETADRIDAETTDRAVRREALLWKLQAMPAFREALFRTDPIAALLDSLGLTLQMQAYFETGPGRDTFGEWRPLVLETCREIEQDHLALFEQIVETGDPSKAVQMVRDWARDNPIRTTIVSRDSIMSAAGAIERRSGTGGLTSGIGVTIDDMVRRVEVYSDQLPRQSRWQAELVLMELIDELDLVTAATDFPRVINGVEHIGEVLEKLDARVDTELALVLRDVERQRVETLAFVAERFEEILEFVRSERMTVIGEVNNERLATTEDIRTELRWLVEVLREERELILGETDTLAERQLNNVVDRVDGMVNGILLKVALLLGVFLIAATLLGLIVVRAARRPA